MCFVEHLGVNRKLDNRNMILLNFVCFLMLGGSGATCNFFLRGFLDSFASCHYCRGLPQKMPHIKNDR